MTSALVAAAFVALGLGFAAMGVPLALGRVPPNRLYGFRTARTLSSPAIWYAANRVQGIDLCIAGVVVAVAAVGFTLAFPGAPLEVLGLTDAGVLVLALSVVTVHGFLVLKRL